MKSKKIILLILVFLSVVLLPITYSKYTKKLSKTITLSVSQPTYTVVFHNNLNPDTITYQNFTYGTAANLNPNTFTNDPLNFLSWNTETDGSGTKYRNKARVLNLSNINNDIIDLYAQWGTLIEEVDYEGTCEFSGGTLSGDCEDPNLTYLNTGVSLFDEDNYQKNFVISFNIDDILASRIGAGGRDTLVSCLYEGSDNVYGKYPGLSLRIEGTKIQLQGGNGRVNSTKKTFEASELIGKEFKIIRHNNGNTIKLYYMIDDDIFFLNDMTNLYANFDAYLTFGAALAADNETPTRYFYGSLSDIHFSFEDDGLTLNELAYGQQEETTFTEVFHNDGPCIFSGSTASVAGTGCQTSSTPDFDKIVNSGINLFDSNYSEDFLISFDYSDYVASNQEYAQATLLSAYKEKGEGLIGYGVLIRRNGNNIQLLVRDGNGATTTNNINLSSASSANIRILKQGNIVCYSVNGGTFRFALNMSGFTDPFNVPVTFGGGINVDGDAFRFFKGTMSNMSIYRGTVHDPELVCPSS